MRVELEIEDLAPGGEALGRAAGRPVYVPFAAPGDRVEVELPPGDGPAHAELLRVLRPGAARVQPPCRHFGPGDGGDGSDRECGGCEWLHVDYARQLAAKERSFAETLRRIGRLAPGSYPLRPIVPSPAPLRYRCRAKLHLDRARGRLAFFRRRSHAPVPLSECHLLEPGLDALREALGPALTQARLAAREVRLEWSEAQGRGAAALELPEVTPAVGRRAEGLLRLVPGLAGLVLLREGRPPVLVGDPVLRHLRDPADPAAGLQRSRPDVFQQANRGANAILVREALALLRPAGARVLELYCGAGNFTGPIARGAAAVTAVEGQGPSLELARRDLAGAPVRFVSGDALAVAGGLAREPSGPRFEAALLDPPRDGARGVGPLLSRLGVVRAVYVSCDPATFARDLRGCVEAGYRVGAVRPFDLFPQTHHVEGLALLER